MFADLDLSQMIPDQFQFSEDYSSDEDAVLDNSEDKMENVKPLKPQKNRNVHALESNQIKPRARKEFKTQTSSSPVGIHIDLTNDATNIQSSPMKELPPGSSDDIPIDLTHNETTFRQPKNPDNILNLTVSASNPSQHHFTYDSEPLSSDNTSFLSDSSLSTSRWKPRKFEKVKNGEERRKRVPVKIVDEVPWDINGDCVYKIKCTEENWIRMYKDGRWFQLCNSTCNGLRGHRKTGKCFGSFICNMSECLKLTTEDIVKTVNFRRIAKDSVVIQLSAYTVVLSKQLNLTEAWEHLHMNIRGTTYAKLNQMLGSVGKYLIPCQFLLLDTLNPQNTWSNVCTTTLTKKTMMPHSMFWKPFA